MVAHENVAYKVSFVSRPYLIELFINCVKEKKKKKLSAMRDDKVEFQDPSV